MPIFPGPVIAIHIMDKHRLSLMRLTSRGAWGFGLFETGSDGRGPTGTPGNDLQADGYLAMEQTGVTASFDKLLCTKAVDGMTEPLDSDRHRWNY